MKREKYIKELKLRMHNGLIKVVTGIRRSGKSYLLFKLFKEYLINKGIDKDHIIEIQLDIRKNYKYRNPDLILDYIEQKIIDDKNYYILLDEVQFLEDFVGVLNSLLHIENVDVYVTGSNSKFLSKDVITEFRGRGDEIHIYPFTFKEFMEEYEGDVYHGWNEYILYGGLPLAILKKTDEQKMLYLKNLFEETYIKDIKERNKIEKIIELNDLIDILASSVGSLTNATKIKNTFTSTIHSDISDSTIRQYIQFLQDAFLISSAYRYDVKGRKYIGTPIKYYFEDVGLRNARLSFRQIEKTHLMENIIYLELKSRGYQVDVGVVPIRITNDKGKRERKQLEIDFIATLGSNKYYIQSAYALPTLEKEKQEKQSLINVNDSFKKIIIVNEVTKPLRDNNGILTLGLFDFLLDENSLDI